VERHKEPRFKISNTITLKVLDRLPGPSLGKFMEGQVVNVSGSGMQIRLPLPVPCGVRVEVHDGTMFILGEVSRCVPADGAYAVGIRVMQTLAALDERRDAEPRVASPARS
jgi:hypothetical protein